MISGQRWSVVLPGSRDGLAALTTLAGETIPKQYWAYGGSLSLLRRALGRAIALCSAERVLVVVKEAERRYWEPELRDVRRRNVLVQPEDRGSAAALALALGEVLRRDPRAIVTLLPSDHYVESESVLMEGLAAATELAAGGDRPIALLAVEPEPGASVAGRLLSAAPGVRRARGSAARFGDRLRGAQVVVARARTLVFTGHFAARGAELAELFGRLLPEIAEPLADRRGDLRETYRSLPRRDFAATLFGASQESLAVVNGGHCGWNDLGTPERVARFLAGPAGRPDWPPPNGLALRDQVAAALSAALAG